MIGIRRMRILNPPLHGILDLVTVAVFALAPTVVGLDGAAAMLSYVLAAVHLLMSLLTRGLPISVSPSVPLPLHGIVELVVGAALGAIGWLAFEDTNQTFYLVMGLLVMVVFLISDYGAEASA